MKNTLFKKYKAVAYLPTAYAIFQYMLLRPYSVEDTLFLIDRTCQQDLIMRLPNYLFLTEYTSSFARVKRWWLYSILYFLSRRSKTIFLSSIPVYQNISIYYFDHVLYLEDGASIYQKKESSDCKLQETVQPYPVSLRNRWCKIVTGPSYPTKGKADKVEKIYLTGILPIPEEIAAKVELFNLKESWNKRSLAEQQEIIRLFLPEGIGAMSYLDVDTLLLTQPLSEDIGAEFTEADKIEMYRKLLSGIDELTVVIKPHPREKTDYRKYFPHAKVFDTLCPMELLEILGMKVRKAITVNSTAIYNLDDSVEKVIAADNPSPKMKRVMTLIWG